MRQRILRHLRSTLVGCSFALWLGSAAAAAAGASVSGKLEQALKDVEDLQYDQARALLLEVIQSGKAESPELMKAYFNLGVVEAGLDNGIEATDAFYLALMLEPTVALPKGGSPKIREYLNDARKRVMQVGVLEARLTKLGNTLGVVIDNDPLSLVKQAKVAFTKADGNTSQASLDPAGKMRIELGSGVSAVQVTLLDESGNQLKVLKLGDGAEAAKPKPADMAVAEPSWVAHWGLWAGVSVFFGATGTYLMVKSGQTQTALDRTRAQMTPDQDVLKELSDDKDRFKLGGLVTLSVAGAAAVAAGTVLILSGGDKEPAQAMLVPNIAPGRLGADLNLRF